MNALVNFNLCTLSNAELLGKVDQMTDQMFIEQKVPTRHIPARPNSDYDLLVGEMLRRFTLLNSACTEVVKGYESDGMEQMKVRDSVFYEICRDATTPSVSE